MTDMPYSYQDPLPRELEEAFQGARTSEGDEDAPRLVLAGLGREALVATDRSLYVLRASILSLGGGWQKASVHALADLAAAEVRHGTWVHRLRLGFHEGPEERILVRPTDRDKMRIAARMLAGMALTAKAHEREWAMARARRAASEAAAGRTERNREIGAPARAKVVPAPTVREPAGPADGTPPNDTLELLKGLWQLVDVGALSEAEFEAKKSELLRRL